MSDFPAKGTVCAECQRRPASVFAAGVPICWTCDEGSAPAAAPIPDFTLAPTLAAMKRVQKAAVRVETVQAKAGSTAAAALRKATFPKGRGQGHRIPLEVKTRVLQASPEMSHAELGRRLGISAVSVYKIRRANGIPASAAPQAPPDAPPATQPDPSPAAAPVAAKTVFYPTIEVAIPPSADEAPRMGHQPALTVSDAPGPESALADAWFKAAVPGAPVTISAGRPTLPAKQTHYATVIADLEEQRANLLTDLEAIDQCLPILRAVHARHAQARHPHPVPQPEELHA